MELPHYFPLNIFDANNYTVSHNKDMIFENYNWKILNTCPFNNKTINSKKQLKNNLKNPTKLTGNFNMQNTLLTCKFWWKIIKCNNKCTKIFILIFFSWFSHSTQSLFSIGKHKFTFYLFFWILFMNKKQNSLKKR